MQFTSYTFLDLLENFEKENQGDLKTVLKTGSGWNDILLLSYIRVFMWT